MKKIMMIFSFVLAFALLSPYAYSKERDKNTTGSPASKHVKSKKQAVADTPSLPDLFQQVSPSVVMILTSEGGSVVEKPGEKVIVLDSGSGVVISKDGFVMTAAQSVHVADVVKVKFLDGSVFPAKVVGSTHLADVALLKLEDVPANLVVAKLGDSDQVRVGEKVFAVCASCGVEHTLTVRHIGGRIKSENLSDQLIPLEFLQTDAAINEDYTGAPMFNMKGEVIGIVSTILSLYEDFEEIGLAASINNAKALLLEGKSFWTGLEVLLLVGPLAKALNVPQEAGFLIQRVAANSPGYRLGLKPGKIPVEIQDEDLLIGGDIVLEVQGIKVSKDIETLRKIREIVQERPGLSRIEFKVLRGGKIVNLFLSD